MYHPQLHNIRKLQLRYPTPSHQRQLKSFSLSLSTNTPFISPSSAPPREDSSHNVFPIFDFIFYRQFTSLVIAIAVVPIQMETLALQLLFLNRMIQFLVVVESQMDRSIVNILLLISVIKFRFEVLLLVEL